MSECSGPQGNYARLKNTGCYKAYNPMDKVNTQPPANCLHNCAGCNMRSAPCANRCCN